MELLNLLEENIPDNPFGRDVMRCFAQLISPFAPHMAEEMWEKLGDKGSIFQSEWPSYDKRALEQEEVEMVVQINGKVRDKIIFAKTANEEEIKSKILESPKIQNWLTDKTIKNIAVVPQKLVNLVIQ